MLNLDEQLINAAETGDLSGLKAALAAGANVHVKDDCALRWAAEKGHLAIVTCLLAAGADVHAKEDYALWWAAGKGHLEVVRCLLEEYGAHMAPILTGLQTFSPRVQIAVLSTKDALNLSVPDLARQGVCPEALCTLLERQGQKEIATLLKATQMLEPLEPNGRAEILANMLTKQPPREINHVAS